jgi:hypothetical protein
MLRSVRVTRVGDTDFPVDEQVDRFRLMEENEKVMNRGGEPADGTPLLLGITKASFFRSDDVSPSRPRAGPEVPSEIVSQQLFYCVWIPTPCADRLYCVFTTV